MPPQRLREELAAEAQRLVGSLPRGSFRAVPLDGLHLTLLFLGEIGPRLAEAIGQALDRELAGRSCLRLLVEGCGAFPSERRPRVLWTAVRSRSGGRPEGRSELLELHRSVLSAARSAGWLPGEGQRERQEIRPHLTLARARGGARALAPGPREGPPDAVRARAWRVDAVELLRSRLDPSGARYERLCRVELRDSGHGTRNRLS